jgi:excinuclease ABC subunit C
MKGNLIVINARYKKEQQQYVDDLAFEKADMIQQKINSLRNYRSSSIVVSPRLGDLDVFAMATADDQIIVSFLAVRNGTITNSGTNAFRLKIEEEESEILSQAIIYFQSLYSTDAKELVVPVNIEFGFEDYQLTIPKTGDKKKLLEMAQTNADYLVTEINRKKRLHLEENEYVNGDLLPKVKEALSLNQLPTHIECFDNSNFQGAYPVSAMVCFKNGLPSKNDYRHFNVKTVDGINDFATMKEAVGRRYKRLVEEKASLPQLVIIDGGKGQLGSAIAAIDELGLSGKMTLVGLAKNVEEIFFAGDQESLKLEFNSDVLKFIRSIRDEVHRYGITFHRQKRSKGTFKNELEGINGIGEKTAYELLNRFRSVKNIRNATMEELTELVGSKKAGLISRHFGK